MKETTIKRVFVTATALMASLAPISEVQATGGHGTPGPSGGGAVTVSNTNTNSAAATSSSSASSNSSANIVNNINVNAEASAAGGNAQGGSAFAQGGNAFAEGGNGTGLGNGFAQGGNGFGRGGNGFGQGSGLGIGAGQAGAGGSAFNQAGNAVTGNANGAANGINFGPTGIAQSGPFAGLNQAQINGLLAGQQPQFGTSVNGLGFATGGFGGFGAGMNQFSQVRPPIAARTSADGPMEIVRLGGPLVPTVMGVREIITNGHVSRVSGAIVQEYFPGPAIAQAPVVRSYARTYNRKRAVTRRQYRQPAQSTRYPAWLK